MDPDESARESAGTDSGSGPPTTAPHNPFDPCNLLGRSPYGPVVPSLYNPLAAHPAGLSAMLAAGRHASLGIPAVPFMPAAALDGYGINPFAAQLQAAAMLGMAPPPGYAEALYNQAKLLQETANKTSQSTTSPSRSGHDTTPSKSSRSSSKSHSYQSPSDSMKKKSRETKLTKSPALHSIDDLSKSSHRTPTVDHATTSSKKGEKFASEGSGKSTHLIVPTPGSSDKRASDSDVSSASAPVDAPSEDSDDSPHKLKKDNQKELAGSSSSASALSGLARAASSETGLPASSLSITDLVHHQKLAELDPTRALASDNFLTTLMGDAMRMDLAHFPHSAFTMLKDDKSSLRKSSKRCLDDQFGSSSLSKLPSQNSGDMKMKKNRGRPKTISDDSEPTWSTGLELDPSPSKLKTTIPTMVSLVVPNVKQQQPIFPGMSTVSDQPGLPPVPLSLPLYSGGHSESDEVSEQGGLDGSMGDDGKPVKRGRFEYDLNELNMPLQRGWRREVRISGMGKRGIVGDVFYFAPCGKKMKTFPDVTRYLDKLCIKDMTKQNFTFSTKLNIGEFYEMKGGTDEWRLLDPSEVDLKLEQSKRKKLKKLGNVVKKRDMVGSKVVRRFREQVRERKMNKEREKLMRTQEKTQRQEQSRMERELRAQQLMEILQDRELKRQRTLIIKEQEREHRRQMLLLSNMDRERRRQHMLLVKALEYRKRQEERDKQREERINEKKMCLSKKLLETQKGRDEAQPTEDMCLKDHMPLPSSKRVKGLKVPGAALADCFMVIEFLNNFKDSLDLADQGGVPTFASLQWSLLGEAEYVDELMGLTCHLLKLCVEDPGFPNPKEQAVTTYGQKLIDIALDDDNMSEVLRIFIVGRNGQADPMAKWLSEKPFLVLSVTKKAAILAFMCNELLYSKNVQAEIDQNIETISNLRRDKWIIEGKLRKLRGIELRVMTGESHEETAKSGDRTPVKRGDGGRSGETASDDEDDSGNESEADMDHQAMDEDTEPEPQTAEECEKMIDKLHKQHCSLREQIFDAGHKLRSMNFGQDRFRRRYWAFTHAGGLYIEGLESAERTHITLQPYQPDEAPWPYVPPKAKEGEVPPDKPTATEGPELDAAEVDSSNIDRVDGDSKTSDETLVPELAPTESRGSDSEDDDDNDDDVDEETESVDNNQDSVGLAPKKMDFVMACGSEEKGMGALENVDVPMETNTNVDDDRVLETGSLDSELSRKKLNGVTNGEHKVQGANLTTVKTEAVKESPLSGQSVMATDSSPKTEPPDLNEFLVLADAAAAKIMSAQQMLKKLTERTTQKPWFSLLPRMPCDEKSITRMQSMTRQQGALMGAGAPYSPIARQTIYTGMGSIDSYDQLTQLFDPTRQTESPCSTPGYAQSPIEQEPSEPIPEDLQHGWWLVSDVEEFREIQRSLHPLGVREKVLQRNLQKYSEYIIETFEKANSDFLGLDSDNNPRPSAEEDSPKEKKLVEPKSEETDGQNMNDEVADPVLKSEPATEGAVEKFTSPKPDAYGAYNHIAMAEAYNQLLEELENLETRVYQASLQVKGWKVPNCPTTVGDASCGEKTFALQQTKDRLTSLERNIERRYLKYPLNKRILTCTSNILAYVAPADPSSSPPSSRPAEEETDTGIIAAGLINWRNGVAAATNCSQLHLCMAQLAHCICWEKSIMKVICQLCQQDDNEAQLLLCDGCDKGYHTYCFKPKMEGIPEGEWYCFDCVSKATGHPHCVVCGEKSGKMVVCCLCNRNYHPECVDPPVQRCPKKFYCVACDNNKQRIAWRNRKRRSLSLQQEKKVLSPKVAKTEAKVPKTEVAESKTAPSSEDGNGKPANPKKELECDLAPCRALLSELESHDKAWPFLKPVNHKQIPQYRKIIRHPMDFQTMKNRLNNSQYNSREDFVADGLLVFNNCETFNEDHSEVGQAGHEMRKFFLKRWSQLNETS